MKRSLLIYFVWSSILIMALVSCRSAIYSSGEKAEISRDFIFSDSFNKITFKAKVVYRESEINGLLLIKNTDEGNFKIAFFNELGMTYLEGIFETSTKQKKLLVRNIAPVLNHKLFLKNFKKSMEIVLTDKPDPRLHASVPPCLHASVPHESILMVKLHNGFRLELSPQITQINTD